tara:strand:+ start:5313 stop:5927 length:615 start_codon:yes stop_codon:yes gene_type:complete
MINNKDEEKIILASASKARSLILRGAGVNFNIYPADVDESALKNEAKDKQYFVDDLVLNLATVKAKKISRKKPDAIVIGSDQLLECGGKWYDKTNNRENAKKQLEELSGKIHTLVTAVAVVRDEKRIWSHIEKPELCMRHIGDDFINYYLDIAKDEVYDCVGAYRLEGLGSQLFDRITGDYFTILGLPLLPLLNFLRQQGIIKA